MSGSLFSAAATLLIGVIFVALLGAGFIWIVPVGLLALVPLLGGALLPKLRGAAIAHGDPTGVPKTADAAYTPQMDPSDRSA